MYTALEKLDLLKAAWVRQIATEGISVSLAADIVRLAELNGLFDASKETFARENN